MTSILEELLGDVLSVRRKGNRTGSLLSRASRVARGVPEVMVKITGVGKSTAHICVCHKAKKCDRQFGT